MSDPMLDPVLQPQEEEPSIGSVSQPLPVLDLTPEPLAEPAANPVAELESPPPSPSDLTSKETTQLHTSPDLSTSASDNSFEMVENLQLSRELEVDLVSEPELSAEPPPQFRQQSPEAGTENIADPLPPDPDITSKPLPLGDPHPVSVSSPSPVSQDYKANQTPSPELFSPPSPELFSPPPPDPFNGNIPNPASDCDSASDDIPNDIPAPVVDAELYIDCEPEAEMADAAQSETQLITVKILTVEF